MLLTVWPEGAETWAKGSCTGFVIHGFTPTDAQTKILYDLLSPGGHICLVAPDDQPTGHTGAIRLEDAGFEIRDAILWVRGSGRLHYVAKAARKEREAGCSKLPAKKGFEVVERNEGSAGVANPRAGAGGLADKIHNFHPTVKSVGIMTALLRDVPKDQGPVLDPFLGSGTTMVACLQTGHSGVGIERDAEYMAIADARVRHWNRVPMGFKGSATVICAKGQQEEVQEEVREEISIFDLASW
jgi:DNA modification methylase